MKRNSFLKGAMLLGFAGIIAKIIGFLYQVPISNILGANGYSYYARPQWIYVTTLTISTGGFTVAISKLVSERMSLKKYKEAKKIFKVAFILLFIMGLIASLLLLFGSKIVMKSWPKDTLYSLLAVSIAPLLVAILTAFRGYFAGLQIMTPIAISQIIEALGRMFFGIMLSYILLSYGDGVAAAGASFGATSGAFISLIIMIIIYYKNRKKIFTNYNELNQDYNVANTKDIVKSILSVSIPIAIGSVATTLMPLIDSIITDPRLIIAGLTETKINLLYSQLTTSSRIIALPLTFSLQIAISLVPAISKAKVLKNEADIDKKIRLALKMGLFIALPSTIGIFALSEPILSMLFPKLSGGGYLLQILSLGLTFVMISQLVTSILQALDKVNIPVRNLLIGSVIKLALTYYLLAIPSINISGAAIATVASHCIVAILNIIALRKYAKFTFDFIDIVVKPLFVSSIMFMIVYYGYRLLYSLINSNSLATIISIGLGGAIYLILMFVIGGITKNQLKMITKRK